MSSLRHILLDRRLLPGQIIRLDARLYGLLEVIAAEQQRSVPDLVVATLYAAVHTNQALGRVHVARAFTCYQVVALLCDLPASTMPHVIFDLPATFGDESVPLHESRRLLGIALEQVQRLRCAAPSCCKLSSIALTIFSPGKAPPRPRRCGCFERRGADKSAPREEF